MQYPMIKYKSSIPLQGEDNDVSPIDMSGVKDIKSLINKTRSYLDQLDSVIEERDRLITVLKLVPSSNDNLDLINCLNKVIKSLNYIQNDIVNLSKKGTTKPEIYEELVLGFENLLNRYNQLTNNLTEDIYVDINEYGFERKEIPKVNIPGKSVRFSDKVEETSPVPEVQQHFKPYRDDEESVASFESQTNPQMYAQHQQQIINQDEDLGVLHNSVRRQHSMGLHINEEIDDHLIMLNDLELGVERSQFMLNSATNKLKSFRQKCRENGSLVTIVVLTVILILLLVVLN